MEMKMEIMSMDPTDVGTQFSEMVFFALTKLVCFCCVFCRLFPHPPNHQGQVSVFSELLLFRGFVSIGYGYRRLSLGTRACMIHPCP